MEQETQKSNMQTSGSADNKKRRKTGLIVGIIVAVAAVLIIFIFFRHETPVLDTGINVNNAIRRAVGDSEFDWENFDWGEEDYDSDIATNFIRSSSAPSISDSAENIAISGDPVYVWSDDGSTVYWYCGSDTVKLNSDSSCMFAGFTAMENIDVSGFDTSGVTDMESMFGHCYSLSPLDVSGFDTGNVLYMSKMFALCENLTTLDVSNFDTSNVEEMEYMFDICPARDTVDHEKFADAF